MTGPAGKQLGSPCTLSPYDLDDGTDPPCPGDVVVTDAGSGYLVVTAKRVDSTVHANRWTLFCVRVDPDDPVHDGARRLTLRWYHRSRTARAKTRRTDAFGYASPND